VNLEFEICEIPILNFDKVHFYTIIKEGASKSEFKDFLDRMQILGEKDKRVLQDLEQIKSEIKAIGTKFGATPRRFKKEKNAYALATHYPKRKNKVGIYGLRIYCIVVNENIVILMNGDDKTAKTAQDCPNVRMKFFDANHLDNRIREYLKNDVLKICGTFLVMNDDETLYW